jgi:tuftelin-interacting protein 11
LPLSIVFGVGDILQCETRYTMNFVKGGTYTANSSNDGDGGGNGERMPLPDSSDEDVPTSMDVDQSDSSDEDRLTTRKKKNQRGGRKRKGGMMWEGGGDWMPSMTPTDPFGNKQGQFGDWEKFTTGIGSKLLKQMGYKGGGLGREGAGIAEPIAVKLRPKNVGLSYANIDEKSVKQKVQEARFLGGEMEEVVEPENIKSRKPKRLWKKTVQNEERRQKVVYKTAEEAAQEILTAPAKPQVILDYRGKDVKIITSMDQIKSDAPEAPSIGGAAPGEGSTIFPALTYNLNLLVDLTEIDIHNIEKNRVQTKDALVNKAQEKDDLEKQVKQEEDSMKRLKEVLDIISKCQQRVQQALLVAGDIPSVLTTLSKVVDMLQHKYAEEYRVHNLALTAVSIVASLLKKLTEKWVPLQEPASHVDTFKLWRTLLTPLPSQEGVVPNKPADPYTRLIVDLILPKLRMTLCNDWSVRNTEPATTLMETWMDVLPPLVMEDIVDYTIMPKLQYEVYYWDPTRDTVPIHAWLHPWLPILGSKLDPLYEPIRHKLTLVLSGWKPEDPSAFYIIAPWKNVFDQTSLEILLKRSILPKLGMALRQFIINPSGQNLELFNAVMLWESVIPINILALLLEVEFFPKWLHVLYTWLSASPNYEEISRWYIEWKKLFPPSLQAHEKIRAQLNHALAIMNRAITGGNPGTYVPPPTSAPPAQPPPPPTKPPPPKNDDMTIKELVEQIALENSVAFLPTKRQYDGKQVYSFGKLLIYMDKQLIMVQDKPNKWGPISPSDLIQRGQSG